MSLKTAIVYLVQNKRSSESYGDDRVSKLETSLDLLHKNYLDKFPSDVLLFHEGDFRLADQAPFTNRWPRVQFRDTAFNVPSFLRDAHVPKVWPPEFLRGPLEIEFGIGYRHMIRFYSYQVYQRLQEYEWYMRLDDDSFLLSPIEYDLFEFMKATGVTYGYRVDTWDSKTCVHGFPEMVNAYLKSEYIEPKSMWKEHQTLGEDGQWSRWGFYNNFHITDLSFWRQPDVAAFLDFMDRVGGGYKYRWSDLPVQSAAVQVFLQAWQVHKFTDFDYEHITRNPRDPDPENISWGGRFMRDGSGRNCVFTKG